MLLLSLIFLPGASEWPKLRSKPHRGLSLRTAGNIPLSHQELDAGEI